jgi:hypothetical protein
MVDLKIAHQIVMAARITFAIELIALALEKQTASQRISPDNIHPRGVSNYSSRNL